MESRAGRAPSDPTTFFSAATTTTTTGNRFSRRRERRVRSPATKQAVLSHYGRPRRPERERGASAARAGVRARRTDADDGGRPRCSL